MRAQAGEEVNGASVSVGIRLNRLLVEAGLEPLTAELGQQFEAYLGVLTRWNARLNLTAVRDEEGILSRHFVESIACARSLPQGISTLLDFGTGAGLPGIPVALCRAEIAVTLAESQGKKAAFLQEAVRVLGLPAKVHAQRAELLARQFDCITLRAVDKMARAVESAAKLVAPGGFLALMTTNGEAPTLEAAAGAEFRWVEALPMPGGEDRILTLGVKAASVPS